MDDTYSSANVGMILHGTALRGPLGAWEHADGYWTEEFAAQAEAAMCDQQPVPCPVCGTELASVQMDAIYGERPNPGTGWIDSGPVIGQLLTLEPCGHTLRK